MNGVTLRPPAAPRRGPRFFPSSLLVPVGAVVDPLQRRVDLGDQLALAVPRPQFDGAIRLRGGAIGEIGVVLVLILKMLQRFPGFLEDLLLPSEQLQAEMLPLTLV